MIRAQDLKGVCGMMPSFTTEDGGSVKATETVDVNNLKDAVDRIINDGVDLIATTGSFGECYNLLFEEFVTLARATTEAAKKRVPVFIGVTSPHTREVVKKMKVVEEAGADGVLAGVPYYIPSTVDNAIQFYHDIADLFPKLPVVAITSTPSLIIRSTASFRLFTSTVSVACTEPPSSVVNEGIIAQTPLRS